VRGEEICGIVTNNGVGVAGVDVDAELKEPHTRIDGLGAFWTGDAFVKGSTSATTDELGRFRLRGLAHGEYELRASDCELKTDFQDRVEAAPITVRAPSQGAVIDVAGAVIEFHFVGVDEPLDDYAFRYTSAGRSGTCTKKWKPIQRFGATAGKQAHIRFDLPGYRIIEDDYAFPRAGQTRTEYLSCEHERPATLLIQWPCIDGAGVRRAAVGISSEAWLAGPLASFPELTRTLEATPSGFLVDRLRPGRYRIEVHPDGDYEGYVGYEREAEFDVVLAEGERATKMIECEIWGRLAVRLYSRDPHISDVPFELFDARGEKHSMICSSLVASGRSEQSNALHVSANELYPNLSPGEYSLEIARKGRSKLVVHASVIAGKTTELAVDLDEP
jgi:hypothetical protein